MKSSKVIVEKNLEVKTWINPRREAIEKKPTGKKPTRGI